MCALPDFRGWKGCHFVVQGKRKEARQREGKKERKKRPAALCSIKFLIKKKKEPFYYLSPCQPAKLLYVQSNVHIFHRQWEMMSHWKVTSWAREPSNASDSELARQGDDLRYGYALIIQVPCSARVFAEFFLSSPFSNLHKMCNLKAFELKSLCSL